MAGTDFEVIILLLIVQAIITYAGYKTRSGIFYLAAGMVGLFGLGEVLANQPINYSGASPSVDLQPISVDMVLIIQAVATMMSFIFLFYERYNVE